MMRLDLRSRGETLSQKALRHFGQARKPAPSKALLGFKPDLVVVNTDSYAWVADETLVASLNTLQAPYVVVLHGAGGFFEDDIRPRARTLYAGARTVCFVSQYTQRMVSRHLAMPLGNAKVIRNPVNQSVDVDNPPVFPFLNGPIVLATMSRLNCYTKGHDHLLEALASPEIMRMDYKCLIYGDGSHRNYIEELISYFGLSGRVQLQGFADQIPLAWRQAHVHVLPSITESAPIALVEAMLCARPSLATRVGGVSEWLVDGQHGYLIEKANHWNLVVGLKKVFENRSRLEDMGKAAHRRAKELVGDPISDFIRLLV
jgi:glycosyltransferase involved in cell wall biosynthesis